MKRKVRFFRQHSLETCGISCMLMVLDAFGKVLYPTEKQERKLYGIYRCRAFKGTLASAIADCLSANGLNVEVYHSSRRFLDNQNGYYPEPLYQAMLEEYTKTIERIRDRVFVETGCRIATDWYRERLDEGKLLIVQCLVPGGADGMHDESLYWILLYGYEEDEFHRDPLSHKIRLTGSEAERYTYAGRLHLRRGGRKQRTKKEPMKEICGQYPTGCLRK
ncbi:MAG: hypothetical protein ACLRWH_05345 [Emergencia sp.]